MKILFIGNHTDKAKDLYDYISKNHPETLTEENPDYIVVAGGDGSMLRAIQKEMNRGVPFFGIGKGTLNFLMNDIEDPSFLFKENFSFENIETFGIEKTKCIEVSIIKKDGTIETYQSANDIVVGGTIMGYHTFNLTTNDKVLDNYSFKSEKVCFSTPLGSTAYHANNNGMIIPDLSYPVIGITTGVGPLELQLNKLVKEQEITLELPFTRDECFVFIDGINRTTFEIGDKVVLKPGKKIKIAFLDKQAFQVKRLKSGGRC